MKTTISKIVYSLFIVVCATSCMSLIVNKAMSNFFKQADTDKDNLVDENEMRIAMLNNPNRAYTKEGTEAILKKVMTYGTNGKLTVEQWKKASKNVGEQTNVTINHQ